MVFFQRGNYGNLVRMGGILQKIEYEQSSQKCQKDNVFCKCLLQTDKSRFNYSSQPTHFSLCWLESTQVFCFVLFNIFQDGMEVFLALKFWLWISVAYLLKKMPMQTCQCEKGWQKLLNMIQPLDFIYHLSFALLPLIPALAEHFICDSGHFETRICIRHMSLHD